MPEGYLLTPPYTLTCPECGGALFPPQWDPQLHYTCHIGHVLSWQSLMEAQLDRIEAALSTGMVVLKERAELCRHVALAAQASRPEVNSETLERMIADADERTNRIKALLEETWITVP